MDLSLIDAILKGYLPASGTVLDVGCGEGRNGLYFIRTGFEYLGIDQDSSKIRLLEYLSSSLSNANASFKVGKMQEISFENRFDLVVASRILHFSEDRLDFLSIWEKLISSMKAGAVIYFAMDSAIATEFVLQKTNGFSEFCDGRVSFALTEPLYQEMKVDLVEVEPLKTIIYQNQRVQSFGLLRKL